MSFRFSTACGLVALLLVQLLLTVDAHGAGYDSSYEAFRGDFNGDGRVDLYLASSRGATVIPLDDIPIVVPPPMRNVVLQSNADGTFNLISSLTQAQRSTLASWPRASVELSVRDIDMDGVGDLELLQLGAVVPNAMDQIVLGNRQAGATPKKLVAKTPKINAFYNDLLGAMLYPNYFQDNAPYRVKSAEPISRQYYGSIRTGGISSSILFVVARCSLTYPGGGCYVTNVPPAQCMQTGAQFNDRNEYIGEDTRNVCSDFAHVFVYVPRTVEVERDYTVFDKDAKEAGDIMRRLMNGCSVFVPSADHARINEIITGVFGTPIGVLQVLDIWSDRFIHPPAPGDELFNQADPTFHHYDVRTDICTTDQWNCDVPTVNALARYYTHPSLRIQELEARPDTGIALMAYIPWFPWTIKDPSTYVKELGPITQRTAQSGYWAAGIQNITTPQHYMYPGTITRKIFQQGNRVIVRTHGIGINRTMCWNGGGDSDPITQGARIFLAAMNTYLGDDAFRTVDRVFVRTWRQNQGYPNSTQLNASPAAVSLRSQ